MGSSVDISPSVNYACHSTITVVVHHVYQSSGSGSRLKHETHLSPPFLSTLRPSSVAVLAASRIGSSSSSAVGMYSNSGCFRRWWSIHSCKSGQSVCGRRRYCRRLTLNVCDGVQDTARSEDIRILRHQGSSDNSGLLLALLEMRIWEEEEDLG